MVRHGHFVRRAALAGLLLVAAGAGPAGAQVAVPPGGAGPGPSAAMPGSPLLSAHLEVRTYATVGTDGSYARVDLVDGGNPDSLATIDVAKRNFLSAISKPGGTDLDDNLADLPASGALMATNFNEYSTGLYPGMYAARIFAANNLYDLLQSTTGKGEVGLVIAPPPGFTFNGFTGGDLDRSFPGGDATGDGGPGLFSNVPGSQVPKLPALPYTMGTLSASGNGRGPSASDQHQFLQIVFPYDLDAASLFNALNASTSFLGDSDPSLPANVFIEARWVQHPAGDTVNAVDQTAAHRHVSGVAVIGGVTAVPYLSAGGMQLATISAQRSHVPLGARAHIGDRNVFTFIAHEDPTLITTGSSASAFGSIDAATGVLTLPDPAASPGGGRVFGGNASVPGAVNDFAAAGGADAAAMGFVSVLFRRLRSQGETVADPYFHSFPVNQTQIGGDPRAVDGKFHRGAALEIAAPTSLPRIEILDVAQDAIDPANYSLAPASDDDPAHPNLISTRARFRIDFDKEVVPNSVGFSRRHTLHTVPRHGTIFPFNGNTRPVENPAQILHHDKRGSPLAASVYVAINQPAGINPATGVVQKVNSPFAKSGFSFKDDGTPFARAEKEGNGLVPAACNTLATLPRGVIPFDIYPLNQNNLQSYVIEPLVELPPNVVLTVGVCMPGLGMSALSLTNRGNFTRSGTAFTGYQGLDAIGMHDPFVSLKNAILGNQTVVKVNAGPMDLQGLLFYGGTAVTVDQLVNGTTADDLTTGGTNVSRTFRVGGDNLHRRVNAPVAPQALYLGFDAGGAGVLDLSGTGYTTNVPGGAQLNAAFQHYSETSRYLPPSLTGKPGKENYDPNGSLAAGDHARAFGILGRYTSNGSLGVPPGTESELAIGGAIPTGSLTPAPGINEGSSGYETLVFSGLVGNDVSTSTAVLTEAADVGVVRDIQVGDFLDILLSDFTNPNATVSRHRTWNMPLGGGAIASNTIADPPFPNPPPLRFPVGLPHTLVAFDQLDLTQPPIVIEGNEVLPTDGFAYFDDGTGLGIQAPRPVNALIQLNATTNASNPLSFDIPPLPHAGFLTPFGPGSGMSPTVQFVQTGPMPETATASALILTTLNTLAPGTANADGLVPPIYQSRQQIGNVLFLADGSNHKLHALNSNTMETLQSVSLPDPYGLGLSPRLDRLYVSNEDDDTLSIVDADPRSATFMTELKRLKVGDGPRAVCVDPDNEDVFVLNYLGNTITIVDVGAGIVRKTLSQPGIDRPYEMACGMREGPGMPAFQSGTYHGYISNLGGNDVLVYQSGPAGLLGIGFDAIVGSVRPNVPPTPQVWQEMLEPRGITYDPVAPLDAFGHTVGCFVAHKDQNGKAVVTRIGYTQDGQPGVEMFNTNGVPPGFGATVFETTAQYLSTFTATSALSVALPDYNRIRFETEDFSTHFNLLNSGAMPWPALQYGANNKFPLANNLKPAFTNGPRWEPDRLYLSLSGKLIEVFDIESGAHLKTITTPHDVPVMVSYFGQ